MKPPIVIIGAPRSGTSLMLRLFRNTLGYVGHNEGHFFTLLQQLINITDDHNQFINQSFQRKSDVLFADERIDLHQDLINLFRKYLHEIYGEKPWVIKTPNQESIKSMDLIARIIPNVRFIYLKRRGIENVLSQTRKFGNGQFYSSFCQEWASCISSFYTHPLSGKSLIVDQLALLQYPEMVVDHLIQFLDLPLGSLQKVELIRQLSLKDTESTQIPQKSFIPIENVPWNEDEKNQFLKLCESSMRIAGYPIYEDEVNSFKPEESFYVAEGALPEIMVLHNLTPWNTIPNKAQKTFYLHPNSVEKESLEIIIQMKKSTFDVSLEALDNQLSGPGIEVNFSEIIEDHSERSLLEITLDRLEKLILPIHTWSQNPVIRVKVSNAKNSKSNNYKSFSMDLIGT